MKKMKTTKSKSNVPTSREEIGRAVHRKMKENSGNREKAVRSVMGLIGSSIQSPVMQDIWNNIGYWVVSRAEQDLSSRGRRPVSGDSSPSTVPGTSGNGSAPKSGKTNGNDPFSSVPDPLDVVLPVGNSGERKPVREWTAEDCRTYSEMYYAQAKECGRKSRLWREVAEKIGNQKLGEAYDSLPSRLQDFIDREAGIS